MNRNLILLLLTLCSCTLSAQLVTNSTMTVQQYVQDVLLGANVSVSNITFNSASANVNSASVGGFDCTDCNLGIASGFAMSTGDVTGMQGPNGSTSYTGIGAGGFSG
ncbi:MAG: choice-of-anchor L domain-containing protein, partial [Flavobacteriales bacterium]